MAEPGGSQPDWLNRPSTSGPSFGSGGFTGASDPGGHSYGRNGLAAGPPSASGSYGGAPAYGGPAQSDDRFLAAPVPGGSGTSFDRPFPTGPGESVGGGGGAHSGDEYAYGSGGYGARKKRKRGALIGPMAGAVGLALLIGVAVYAFMEKGAGCSGEKVVLNVAVVKEIQPAVKAIADDFSSDAKSCATAKVTVADPSTVRTQLIGEGVSSGGAAKPDVWIPDSSLWAGMVQMKASTAVTPTNTKLATSPVVVVVPKTLHTALDKMGVLETPSWDNLLSAAGGLPGGAVTKNQLIDADMLDLRVLSPNTTGPGMASISMVKMLLKGDENANAIFTAIMQTIRKATRPTIQQMYARFHQDARGRFPLLIAPEQSVQVYNGTKPKDPAVAIYPQEGMVSMDYPVLLATSDKDKLEAARKLERALVTPEAVKKYQALGFRTTDHRAPETFTEGSGLSAKRVSPLPTVSSQEIYDLTQDWAKLSLGMRMLAILDISGTMGEPIAPGKPSRMQSILATADKGMQSFQPDSQLGVWVFSDLLDGKKDYKEVVPIASLNQRFGATSQVDRLKQALLSVKVLPNGNTGLYDTIYGSYSYMRKTYAQDRINSIVLFTDGVGNDDKHGGLSHAQLLQKMKKLVTKDQPIQLIVISIGSDKKVLNLLSQIALPTGGAAYVPKSPDEISKIFLQAVSKRMCDSSTGKKC
ncbi:substrate-binding domain-containing protein [Actinocorallia lasiicapitis]